VGFLREKVVQIALLSRGFRGRGVKERREFGLSRGSQRETPKRHGLGY